MRSVLAKQVLRLELPPTKSILNDPELLVLFISGLPRYPPLRAEQRTHIVAALHRVVKERTIFVCAATGRAKMQHVVFSTSQDKYSHVSRGAKGRSTRQAPVSRRDGCGPRKHPEVGVVLIEGGRYFEF